MAKKYSKKKLRKLRQYKRLKRDVFEALRGYHRRETGVVGVSGPNESEYVSHERYYADLENEVFYYQPHGRFTDYASYTESTKWEGGPYGYRVELTPDHLREVLASP